jgi:hypothetical protein
MTVDRASHTLWSAPSLIERLKGAAGILRALAGLAERGKKAA